MKANRKQSLIFFLAIVIASILWATLMDRNDVRTHDVSQLVPSKHDAVISNDYNVEIIAAHSLFFGNYSGKESPLFYNSNSCIYSFYSHYLFRTISR